MTVDSQLSASGTPIPPGRGRWRLTLHTRQFAGSSVNARLIAELVDARSRSLVQAWNTSATLTFVIDGHSQAAQQIGELTTDVIAWRWDEVAGKDFAVFRGPITQTQDTVSEQTHTVTVTCHDNLALLARRILTTTYATPQQPTPVIDQDQIVVDLLNRASNTSSSSGTSFSPGSFVPLAIDRRNPDGSFRGLNSGQLRVRTYPASTVIGEALDNLAKVIGGFDYDIEPITGSAGGDRLRVWYPNQGVVRSSPALVYGSTVASLTRAVNSADYANYWRVLGNNGSADPAAVQLFSEAWNADANNVGVTPIGLWMNADNAADVTIQSTLDQQAQGDLALSGVLVPNYTLGLRPGVYSWGNPNMGDVVPLIVQSGRLNVNTTIRVLGISYAIGDDGQEDVALTVGRPATTLGQLLQEPYRDVNALVRR